MGWPIDEHVCRKAGTHQHWPDRPLDPQRQHQRAVKQPAQRASVAPREQLPGRPGGQGRGQHQQRVDQDPVARDQELRARGQHERGQPARSARMRGAAPGDQQRQRGGGGGDADGACGRDTRAARQSEHGRDGPVVERRLLDEALAIEGRYHPRRQRHFAADLGLAGLIGGPQSPVTAQQCEQRQCQRRQQGAYTPCERESTVHTSASLTGYYPGAMLAAS